MVLGQIDVPALAVARAGKAATESWNEWDLVFTTMLRR